MAGQDNGVIACKTADKIAHLDDLHGVKTDRGLVQNNNFGIAQQCLGQTDTLLITLGQVAAQTVAHMCYAGLCHGALDFFLELVFGHVFDGCRKCEILFNCHLHVERGQLGKISDASFCFLRLFQHVVAVNEHSARGGGYVTGDDVHRGRFTCTVGTQKTVYLSFFNGEAYFVDCIMITVFFYKMFYLDQIIFLLWDII